MDSGRFDRVAKTLAQAGTRRGVVRLLAVLPVAGALSALLGDDTAAGGRHKRRTTRNKRHSGNDKDNRTGKRKGKRTGKKRDTPASAPAGCTPTTCAAQGKNCGPISDGCGATLDCTPACCETQTCQSECRADGCSQGEACGGGGTANVCGCVAFGMVTDDENRGACCDSSCCGEDLNGQPLPDGQCMCSTGCG
jgi:hypothetical protein